MERLRAIIVDDERLARKELRSLLSDVAQIEVVGEAENIVQALQLIQTEKPQVLFLDIQLVGETGFDLLEKVGAADFKTIFVTAFDAFAIRAFEVNALDYLLKPVNSERLKKAIEKLVEEPEAAPRENLRRLEYDDRLFLELGQRSVFLKVNRISHILSSGDYSEVFTSDAQKFLVEKPLREWEARLPEKHFVRIHRGAIVNLECVERVESWFNRSYQIYLQNNREPLAVSRRYAAKLKEKFG
jgi:two-component system, LytTR family, response regulator